MIDELKASAPEALEEIRRVADATENAKHLLWKVEDPQDLEKPPSYLFGTIHLTDDRVTRLSKAVRSALINSVRVAVEIEDLSPHRLSEAFRTLSDRGAVLLPERKRLDAFLSPGEAQLTVKALGRTGLPADVVSRVRPWVALVMLATPDCERSRMIVGRPTVDGAVMQLAEKRELSVVGMETVELQFRAMADLPEADQLGLLKAQLAIQPRISDVTETLVQLYLQRDLGAIWPFQLALAQSAGVDPKVFDSFKETLLRDRNTRMLGRMHGHIARGGLFMAVGALHLIGKDGMVAQLQAAGMKVTPVE
jgi:uncharacterized protein YbaP (TraB family)